MKEFIESQKFPYTAIDVKSYLKSKLDIDLPVQWIRKWLRNKFNYSFKRFSSKPINIDLEKLSKLRKIFSIKFSKNVNEDTLIINVDESTLSRSCKSFYSWSKKGQSTEFKNIIFQGSLSMILAVSFDENWLMGIKRNTINSNSFVQFIANLEKWVNDNNRFGYIDILITLDNCRWHFSKLSLIALSKIKMRVMFLCPYSPDFAPVEQWFSFIKQKLILNNKTKYINLNNDLPLTPINNSVKDLKQSIIKNYYRRFNYTINSFLT